MRSLNVVLSWVIKWSIMALQLKNDKKYKQENSGQGCEEIHQQRAQLHHQSRTDTVINHQSLSYSLADAGGIHLEEGVVHEEVKGLLFPGSAGVLVPAEAAQQLDAGSVTRSVVCTVRRSRKTYLRQQRISTSHFTCS